jgi:hypothetical protein
MKMPMFTFYPRKDKVYGKIIGIFLKLLPE